MTPRTNVLLLDGNELLIPGSNNQRINLPLIETELHSFLPSYLFERCSDTYIRHEESSAIKLTASTSIVVPSAANENTIPWPEARKSIDKEHRIV